MGPLLRLRIVKSSLLLGINSERRKNGLKRGAKQDKRLQRAKQFHMCTLHQSKNDSKVGKSGLERSKTGRLNASIS